MRATGRASKLLPRRPRDAPAALALLAVVVLAGCGGGSRQDANEPEATYRMRATRVSFPHLQAVSRPVTLEVVLRNVGTQTVPAATVTVDSLTYASRYAALADPTRPIWVIERGPGAIAIPPVESQEVSPPGGAQTAATKTWSLGSVPPGHSARFVWKLVPVKPGTYTLHFAYAAGVAGKSKVRLAVGSRRGAIIVHIAGKPPSTHVNPETGRVVPGPYRPSSEAESS
ncbi:MAG TPA: hypothetical protein VMB91_13530 [Solirubrobacteraceae bacterium]|nr:hypothetical protein [Solirubrobacteraceae bacterium]